jgi:hypothetical protein
MKKLKTFVVLAILAALPLAVYALVTFDPNTGTGFVGKGDVQLAFGWNNKQAQDNAKAVSFSFESDTHYDVVCYWETETGGPQSKIIEHYVTNHKNASISSSIVYDARLKNQYTGYNLTGFGATETTGEAVPQVGDACKQAHETAVVTEVNVSSDSAGGLYVSFGGNKVLLQ